MYQPSTSWSTISVFLHILPLEHQQIHASFVEPAPPSPVARSCWQKRAQACWQCGHLVYKKAKAEQSAQNKINILTHKQATSQNHWYSHCFDSHDCVSNCAGHSSCCTKSLQSSLAFYMSKHCEPSISLQRTNWSRFWREACWNWFVLLRRTCGKVKCSFFLCHGQRVYLERNSLGSSSGWLLLRSMWSPAGQVHDLQEIANKVTAPISKPHASDKQGSTRTAAVATVKCYKQSVQW